MLRNCLCLVTLLWSDMGWSAMCNCGIPWPCSLTFVAQCMLKAIKKGVSVRPSIDAMRGYFVSAKLYTVLA